MISEAGIVAHISPSHWVATGAVDHDALGAKDAPISGDTAINKTLPVTSSA
ncbi:hypothetical protein HVE01_23110 [Vreelandella venusta]|nr:hypothetical protein HVE01_23110 [Halomonas venusta]